MMQELSSVGLHFKVLSRWGFRLLATLVLICAARESAAVDRVILEAGEISIAGARASGATATVDLTASPTPAVDVQFQQLVLGQSPGAYGEYHNLEVFCTDLLVKEPEFACRKADVTAIAGPLGSVAMAAAGGYDSLHKTISFSGSGFALAGGRARFTSTFAPEGWSLQTDASALDLLQVRKLAAPWVHLPDAYSFNGHVDTSLEIAGGQKKSLRLRIAARTSDLSFTNQEGTVVAQKIGASFNGTAIRKADGLALEGELGSSAGQALAGPVLLDFGVNPLKLQARAAAGSDRSLRIDELVISQKGLVEARGQGQVMLAGHPTLTRATLDVQSFEFPAAYRSFLQLPLATTDFGALSTTGKASGSVVIADNSPEHIDIHLPDLGIDDPKGNFSMAHVTGDLHWAADANANVEASHLAWSRGSAYGLGGGAANVSFALRERSFTLLGDTRLPIFDGALVVHTLAGRKLGSDAAELDFDAHIEPISMPMLSRAFGWPELSGLLAGRIPGVTYRNHVLAVDGDLVAKVFDGTIVGSHFRLRDPLGPWPRLFADVTARGLDLDLVTHTFSIGSITGRLDADVNGLELFNWSPVAFDARLYSTPGDRSKHRISQKAVTSISSIGGGGNAVTAALQSGALRFFDRFGYDRIGISCELRNDICLMGGIEPARSGYYMVKGSGLPRIDIIGNSGRVDWEQLVSQIVQGMHTQNLIVR